MAVLNFFFFICLLPAASFLLHSKEVYDFEAQVYAPFLFFLFFFFFAMLCKKSGAVLVCVFVCVRLALQVCIVFLCSLLDGVRSESPFSLCHRAFGVCTSFLQIVRSDPAVCSDFPAL